MSSTLDKFIPDKTPKYSDCPVNIGHVATLKLDHRSPNKHFPLIPLLQKPLEMGNFNFIAFFNPFAEYFPTPSWWHLSVYFTPYELSKYTTK